MIKSNGLTKTISVVTSATTILWLSGLAMLAPMAAGAVTINEGDIIRGPDGIKVYIVNADGYKRHIFNPAIFNMYGHLKWSNIKDVDQATLDSYTTSDLYRADGDPKVYNLEEVSEASGTAIKHHFNMTADEFVASGYNWKQIFIVNPTERDYYSTGSDLTYTAPPVVTTGVAVALDASTPAASSVAGGAQDVIFTKVKFTAGTDKAYSVSSLTVTRGGISADSDLSSIKLYDGTTKLGSTQALNTTTHKATFTGLTWSIPAGTSKVLTIKGSMAAAPGAGNLIKLGIGAASDITLASGSISGTFPVNGNGMTPTTQSVGRLDVEVQASPAAATVLSGSTDQPIASWKFSATATEGFYVNSIKLTEVGTSVDADVLNIKLKVSGAQIGSTAAALSNSVATFDLSAAPIYVQAGGNKTVYAYADISSGVTTARTVKFEVSLSEDVVAYGANSGGMVTITGAAGASFTKQTGAEMTVGQGSLTVDHYSAIRPAAQDYVKGTSSRLWTAWDFSAGSREGARVVKLVLTASGCSSYTSTSLDCSALTALTAAQLATDVSNVGLYSYNPTSGAYTLITTASLVGGVVTFGANTSNAFDSPGLFDVAASGHTYIAVKADVPTGATTNHGLRLGIAANTDVWIDGLASQNDIAQTAITVNGTSRYSNYHRIKANGVLTSAKGTPLAGAVIVKGTSDNTMAWFNLTADSGEDILVSAVEFDWTKASGTQALASGDITNAKLYDGTTLLGSAIAAPVATTTFSVNLTIPAGTTKILKVTADLPSTSSVTNTVRATWDVSETTATGSASGATITDSNTTDIAQDDITVASGALTTTVKTPPISQNVIRGATTPIAFATFLMTAGVAEDVRVSSIKLTADGDTDGSDFNFGDDNSLSGDNVVADIDQVYLYDGDYNSTTVLTGPMQLVSGGSATTTNATVTFTGFALTVPKSSQKMVTVKATVKSTATADNGIYFGVAAAADITATGLSTNSDLTLTSTPNSTSTTAVGMNIKASGALYAQLTSGALPSASYVAGNSGVEFASLKLTAKTTADVNSAENVIVSGIRITANSTTTLDGAADNIKRVYVYNGTTLLGSSDWDTANGAVDVSFASPYVTVNSGQDATLVIKADLASVTEGADSGDTPRLGVEYNIQSGAWTASYANKYNIVAKGAMSNQYIYATAPTGNPAANLRGNQMAMRKSVPTLSNASLPTTVLAGGTQTLYRWAVSPNAAGDTGWKALTFHFTGSLYTTATAAANIGTDDVTTPVTDGIYLIVAGDSGATADTKAIDESTMVVTDETANTSVAGAWYFRSDTDAGAGTYAMFVATNEQVTSVGVPRTYKLEGNLLYGSLGGALNVRVENLASAFAVNSYNTVAGTNDADSATTSTTTGVSFVWTDRSAASHDETTADWADDYKISGIPLATQTLSK